ncbi:MAG: four helix bundle protein [Tepidisphaeraceae bacterium]
MANDFKDLVVWQRSMDFVVTVYGATRHFPVDERFGLTNQLRRAAVSVPSNIAEGQGRRARSEFIRYLRIADGSRQEAETQLLIAHELGFLDNELLCDLTTRSDEIARLLSGLIRSLKPSS